MEAERLRFEREQQRKKLEPFMGLRLHLGCGPNKQAGFFGVDSRRLPGVDLVHDLEVFPWPLPDSVTRLVVMSHFWEHIHPKLTLRFMAELHRVCQHGAEIAIAAPYGNGFRFTQDPTHCNPSNEATFLYWDLRHPLWEVYQPPVFHLTYYEIIPAGHDRDFNARLICCKPEDGKTCTCALPVAQP